MRALSLTQANRCETAIHPKCKCRCHGELHGVRRLKRTDANFTPEFFENLPEDDPHHVADARIKAEDSAKKKGVSYEELLDKFFPVQKLDSPKEE